MDENKMTELNRAIRGMWDSLTDEQKEKAKKCQNMDELMLLAGRLGIELPDEMLDTVAGGRARLLPGGGYEPRKAGANSVALWCPFCRIRQTVIEYKGTPTHRMFRCPSNGRAFFIDRITEDIIDENGEHWCGPQGRDSVYYSC